MGRPSKLSEYEPSILKWLKTDPELKTVAIFQRLRDEGYKGGKSAVYEFVRKMRPPKSEGIVRFEAVAGEFSQHDFGTVWVRYENGERERLKFFASRLKFSRLSRIFLVPDETTESVCLGVADAFQFFGGMPAVALFDNPKTIVEKRDGKHVTWNQTFAQFTFECGFSPMATWPRRPQEKGSVENVVGFAKTFFKSHTFADHDDLIAKLEVWHSWANDERKCRATGEIPRERFLLEAERLKPVQLSEEGFSLKDSRIVRTDGYVSFEGILYFAGLDRVGQTATLHVGQELVDIYVGSEHLARHPRKPANGKYSVLAGQREQLLEKSGARIYMKRQLMMDLCPAAEWVLTEIRHRRPDHWEKQVEKLFELLVEYGDAIMRDAFIEIAQKSLAGADYVEAFLKGQARSEVQG